MRIAALAVLAAAMCALVAPDRAGAADAACPKSSKESLAAWHRLTSTQDPVLAELYEKQTRVVARIKKLAESGGYSLDAYRALQKEHDEVKIAMERRRSENTVEALKALPAADQRQVLLFLYGGC